MKNAKQIIAPTAIIVFIFWPWLLRGVDLAWMIVFGEWLTKADAAAARAARRIARTSRN